MPELPEVEVVRRGISRWATGARIERVDVLHDRPLRRQESGPVGFTALVERALVAGVRRRGKFCWLDLTDAAGDPPDRALVVHLGMSGQMLFQPPGTTPERHLRVRFELSGGPLDREGRHLHFVDQRMFGGLTVCDLVATPDEVDGTVPLLAAHIARDLLDPLLDRERVVETVRRRSGGVKRALLDQTLVSGVGNIYADEALWRAQVHPERPGERLTRPAVRRVLDAAEAVMREALDEGGTSFDALYVDVNGSSGYFDRSLAVYGQEGRPCLRCHTMVRRAPWMNRSMHWCPRCQPAPRRGR